MRHAALRNYFDAQRALGCDRDSVLGRLTIDQKFAPLRFLVCHFRTQAVALLADQEKQSDVNSFFAQPFRGFDLGGDDSLGIAGAPSVDPRVASSDEGMNGGTVSM